MSPAHVSRLHAAVLLIGALGISYEIVLMRALSIAQWHHFAYMIISVAMLGFAVSGTAIALLRRRIQGRERPLLAAGALALSASLTVCFTLSQRVPFETFRLTSEPAQFSFLLALYLILAIPFFLVSWCVALGFLVEPKRIGRVYFFNMLGSGLGAAAVVALLFWLRPAILPIVLTAPAALAFSLAAGGLDRRWQLGLLVPAGCMLLTGLLGGGAKIRLSEYKGLAHALRLPDARVVARSQSPLSELTAVASTAIRETPGQLSGYPMRELGELPEQIGLYFDGGSVSAVSRFDGSLEPFAFLDYVTGALPYHLTSSPETLVVGAGGGIEVLGALYHGARHVTAVEVDPGVHAVVQRELHDYSGGLYARADVTLVLAEGRGYLEGRPDGSLDLIQFALLDSFSAASAGVHALAESYLYTTEAIQLYLRKLRPGGILSITRWLKTPPRDAIKLFGTMVEAAERAGIAEPGRHLAFVRSWNTGTIVLSRSPLTDQQIGAVRAFATARGLDMGYVPGIARSEVNRFIVLDEPIYYEAATALLSDRRERFHRDYAFHVRPASDDRPYFFHFFRWSSAGRFIEGARQGWFSLVEWGYLALVATVVQAAVAGFLLVLLPLVLFARGTSDGLGAAATYFTALGFAFMFLEIAFIQRFMLFLAYPVYAVAVVLTSFLVFSGIGAYAADRRLATAADRLPTGEAHRRLARAASRPEQPLRLVRAAVLMIAGLGVAYLLALSVVFRAAASWPDSGRIALSLLLLSPLAFFMGVPFPAGLQLVSDRRIRLVPWAWGLNGAASVLGAALATFLAVHLGFRAVVLLAFVWYGAAAVALGRMRRWAEAA